jgi:cyclophilin family peptidyl-prolyl cis-trans isomerase
VLLEQAAAGQAGGGWVLRRGAGAALGALDRPVPALGSIETGRLPEVYREIVQRTWEPRTVELRTSKGPIRIRLACREAPLTCLNFLQLAGQGFYNGVIFHRVVPDFVVQAGDPRGDGFGGPGYDIRDEINRLRYRRGTVGMALAGPDTGGSQFFIALSEQPHLDGGYTVFGEVVAGDEILDRIVPGDQIEAVEEVR